MNKNMGIMLGAVADAALDIHGAENRRRLFQLEASRADAQRPGHDAQLSAEAVTQVLEVAQQLPGGDDVNRSGVWQNLRWGKHPNAIRTSLRYS